jgi:hypothetical protein
VLAACNNTARITCAKVTNISFHTCHVIIHYLITGLYQSLEPIGDTDAEKCLYEFETAVDVHRSAMFVNLPSLRDLACRELIKICDNMDLQSIVLAMEELKVSLDDFPQLAAYIKAREMHAKERLAKKEADAPISNLHNKPSSHQFYNLPKRPHPSIQKQAEDARMRIRRRPEEQPRILNDRSYALKKYLAIDPQTTKKAPTDRLVPQTASAEAEKAGSEENLQQKREISANERLWPSTGSIQHEIPIGANEFVYNKRLPPRWCCKRANRAVPSRDEPCKCKDLYKDVYRLPPMEDTAAASTNDPKPVLPPAVKAVSNDWDVPGYMDESEKSDYSRTLGNSWHNLADKETSDAPEEYGMRGY